MATDDKDGDQPSRQPGTKSEWCKWKDYFGVTLRRTVIGLLIAGVIGAVGAFLTGTWDQVVAIWTFPQTYSVSQEETRELIRGNAIGIGQNERAIERLRIPRDIFSVSARSSGPVQGYCASGQPCEVNVRVRREPDAIQCNLTGRVDWFYFNPRDGEEHQVTQIAGQPQDVGEVYQNFLFTLSTPYGLEPDAELCLRPHYSGCPGQYPDDPAISPDTECIDVEVR